MKKIALAVALTLSIISPSIPVHSEPVATIIAGSTAVSSLISQIKKSVNETISEAEASSLVIGFSLATDANILLQNLDIMSQGLIDKAFSELNASQQAVFNNAFQLLNKTDSSLAERLEDIDSIVSGLGAEIARIPGISERPLLKKYQPSYILNNKDSYSLVMNGSLLNGMSPVLQFGDATCTLVSSVENKLHFDCPAKAFNTEGNKWATGKLGLTKPRPWYRFWANEERFDYSIGVMAIQEKMGSYSLAVTKEVSSNVRIPRSQTNNYRNNHCDHDRILVRDYRPADGCTIDVTTVEAVATVVSARSSFDGVLNVSSFGFQSRGYVRNRGGPPCGWDARGALNVTACQLG